MKFASGVVAVILMATCALAQEAPKSDKVELTKAPVPDGPMTTQTFFLKNASGANDGNELLTGIRLLLPPRIKMYLLQSQNALTLTAGAEDMALAKKLIDELDKPKKTYRLSFTITESDGTRKIGVQHTSMVIANGQRTTMKNGSKVPVATGSYNSAGATSQTQFTYLDVGINIDATLNEVAGGAQLKAKVEQSSIGEDRTFNGIQEPIVRQSVMEGVSMLQVGKPEVIGSLDITGSTRHLDIEVVMEPVK